MTIPKVTEGEVDSSQVHDIERVTRTEKSKTAPSKDPRVRKHSGTFQLPKVKQIGNKQL